jgi:hypothetical protein
MPFLQFVMMGLPILMKNGFKWTSCRTPPQFLLYHVRIEFYKCNTQCRKLYNMINKINKGRRRSMNVTPHNQVTRTSGKEPRKTGQGTRQRTDRIIS